MKSKAVIIKLFHFQSKIQTERVVEKKKDNERFIDRERERERERERALF